MSVVSRRSFAKNFPRTVQGRLLLFTLLACLVCGPFLVVWRVRHAKEEELRLNLFTMRSVISQYTLDKQKAPQSLEDLIPAGYIKVIPKDPFTNEANWTTDQETTIMAVDQQEPGIVDVHSSSNLSASDGTTYSSW